MGKYANCEVKECSLHPSEWIVEDIGGEGEVYMTRFSGPDSENRARDYAEFMNDGTLKAEEQADGR